MSSKGGKSHWTQHAEDLNKCYMIVNRALPEGHIMHMFVFYIGPDGNVMTHYDQSGHPIKARYEKYFQQILKTTKARAYNDQDVLQTANKSLMKNYITHHQDFTLLSKVVLTADDPSRELGEWFRVLITCAELNAPACCKLVLAAANQCTTSKTEAVINKAFLDKVREAAHSKVRDDVEATLVAMMPSLAEAGKLCTDEVLVSAQGSGKTNKVIHKAIFFGNRSLVDSLINKDWTMLSSTDFSDIKPEKILSLGAEINQLLLDSGFLPSFRNGSFTRALLLPSSKGERETADTYFSSSQIQHAPDFVESLRKALQKEHRTVLGAPPRARSLPYPLLDNMPWRLEKLKRFLGENSELYVNHVVSMLTLVAGEGRVEIGVVRYLPQITLLLDEVNRLEKVSSKKTLTTLGLLLGKIKAAPFSNSFDIKFAEQSLPEDSRAVLGRLLVTMQDYGAEVSTVYMSLLAREGYFDLVTRNGCQGKKGLSISLANFLHIVMGRPECRNGRFPKQWLTAAESWLQDDHSWFDESDRDIIGRLLKVLRDGPMSENRLSCLLNMATQCRLNYGDLPWFQPRNTRKVFGESYWSEAYDSAVVFSEFLQTARKMQLVLNPVQLSSFLWQSSEPVKAWSFSAGWDDILSAVGDEGDNLTKFFTNLLGYGFVDYEPRELSYMVQSLVEADSCLLVPLAASVERTAPCFDAQGFTDAVNELHGKLSTGDIMS